MRKLIILTALLIAGCGMVESIDLGEYFPTVTPNGVTVTRMETQPPPVITNTPHPPTQTPEPSITPTFSNNCIRRNVIVYCVAESCVLRSSPGKSNEDGSPNVVYSVPRGTSFETTHICPAEDVIDEWYMFKGELYGAKISTIWRES